MRKKLGECLVQAGLITETDLQTALGTDVLHSLPNDYVAVTDSVNQGVPVLQLSRNSAVAKSLGELVEIVTARRVVTESRGIFDRLFGRADSEP